MLIARRRVNSALGTLLHMREAGNTTWRKRIDRPLGVYLITIYDFFVVGLIPLATFVLLLRNSDTEFSFTPTLLSVGLYFLVMAASVWARVGDNVGRWLLLAVVTLTAATWISNAVFVLSNLDPNLELSSGEIPRVIGYISRGVISLALNWWYFNRKTTVAYYKRDAATG